MRTKIMVVLLLALVVASQSGTADAGKPPPGLPDLTISDVTFSPAPWVPAGGDLTVSATVVNLGLGRSEQTVVEVHLHSLLDGSDTPLWKKKKHGLGSGRHLTVTKTAAVPAPPGPYDVVACVDPDALVAEAIETNNCRVGGQIAVTT